LVQSGIVVCIVCFGIVDYHGKETAAKLIPNEKENPVKVPLEKAEKSPKGSPEKVQSTKSFEKANP
jgi:hypothetical protein